MNTILQVPVDKEVKNKATAAAQRLGFSSLQEAVRLFLNKMAAQQLEIKFEEIKLKLGKIGTFSVRRMPNIVWVNVEGGGIYELQKKIDEKLKNLFAMEERFMGHLTIARIKYVEDKKGFLERIKLIHVKPIEFSVSGFRLKKSKLDRVGPKYEDIEVYS